jgi:hypothetical protein
VFVLVALVSGLLTGALGVGDALRASLRARVEARVGPTDLVVDAGEGFFSALLAADVAEATGADVAPLLRLEGVGRADGNAAWMMLLGVDGRLARLAPDAPPTPGPGEVVLREDIAAELGVAAGDAVVFRFERPSLLSRDIALVQEEGRIQPLRLTVAALAPAAWPMTFALDARPMQPAAALVDRAWLAEKLGRADEANLLVVHHGEVGAVTAALDRAWQLSDGGLSTTPTADGGRMLLSERVLLPPPVADAAAGAGGAPVLTWFADSLSAGERTVPYAFVAGVPEVGAQAAEWFEGPEDHGVVLQADTAARLGAAPGSEVKLRYPVLERGRQVRWLDADLTVRAVLPAAGAPAYWMDPAWSPVIEGLSGKSRCRDWNPGLPVDLGRVGDADEAWWTAHGPTPQAFVPVGLAKKLWASAWGDATGVRFGAGTDEAAIDAALHAALSAASVGLVVREVRGPMLASAAPSNDFGVLFLSFEGILILALLALLAIGGAIVVDGRAAEIGLVRAVGWSGAAARRWVLAEAFSVVAFGALVGIPVGIGVRTALLFGLQTAWWKATGALALSAGGLRAAWAGPGVAAARRRGGARAASRGVAGLGADRRRGRGRGDGASRADADRGRCVLRGRGRRDDRRGLGRARRAPSADGRDNSAVAARARRRRASTGAQPQRGQHDRRGRVHRDRHRPGRGHGRVRAGRARWRRGGVLPLGGDRAADREPGRDHRRAPRGGVHVLPAEGR